MPSVDTTSSVKNAAYAPPKTTLAPPGAGPAAAVHGLGAAHAPPAAGDSLGTGLFSPQQQYRDAYETMCFGYDLPS